MRVITNLKDLLSYRSTLPCSLTVGFVPTMGSLHEGHLSLIDLSLSQTDHTVVSVFVNPKQFAPTEDLSTYPRSLEADVELCSSRFSSFRSRSASEGVRVNKKATDSTADSAELNGKTNKSSIILFAPSSNKEIYPESFSTNVSVSVGHAKRNPRSEAASRPSFFTGVATVLSRLFGIVRPSHVFFGQKDAQQCAVVNQLVKDMFPSVQLVVGPVIRDPVDGVALSSRNAYLTDEEREQATVLFKALKRGKEEFEKQKKQMQKNFEMENKFDKSSEKASKQSKQSKKRTQQRMIIPDAELIREAVLEEVKSITKKYVRIDYVSICDRWTMVEADEIDNFSDGCTSILKGGKQEGEMSEEEMKQQIDPEWILCIAGHVGTTRLIDNVLLTETMG